MTHSFPTRRSSDLAFLKWAEENSQLDALVVQQLVAHGYRIAADQLSSLALDWLLLDPRRFQLGTRYSHRQTTVDLVRACAPRWSNEEIARFERTVLSYRPPVPEHLEEPKQRKFFADMVRSTKKDLLQAVGVERLAAENRELVATEQRAMGGQFNRAIGEVEGGRIGSLIEAAARERAKDRDNLQIYREIKK